MNEIHSALSKISRDRPELVPLIAGSTTFAGTLALSTFLQQQLFHITTATRPPGPSAVGFATVCAASLASHAAAIASHELVRTGKLPQVRETWFRDSSFDWKIHHNGHHHYVPMQAIRM
jgi:hypothetical protein